MQTQLTEFGEKEDGSKAGGEPPAGGDNPNKGNAISQDPDAGAGCAMRVSRDRLISQLKGTYDSALHDFLQKRAQVEREQSKFYMTQAMSVSGHWDEAEKETGALLCGLRNSK